MPEKKKKIVFFSVLIVVGLVLLVFAVKNTKDGIAKIGQSASTISLPKINIPDYKEDMPAIDFGSIVSNLASLVQTAEFLEYKNEEYGFEIKHPASWTVDNKYISKNELSLTRGVEEKETAGIHIEVISRTERLAFAQAGIEKAVLGVKEVIVPKREIMVGAYSGYEAVGTLCIKESCPESAENEMYAPFSIIYFSDGKEIFEAQYGEGVMGAGWKNNIIDWKYYEEFKNIISTFKYIK